MTEPKIRFKRDDGRAFPDWEQVPFGDVIEQYSERTKTENEDTLLSCAIEGVYLNSELFGHQRGSSTIGYKKIDKGTLILSAQNLHLGNANVNLRFEHGMISPAYNTYHIKGCDVNFMAQWIKREATKKFFFDATTTGASECRRNVMWDELYKQKIGVPSLPEQHKIADFLSNVDEVIAASEEEVANLEQQKKAVMQKIFFQEVRFKKEDGSDFPDWEEKRLNQEADFLQGLTYSPADVIDSESGVRVLRSSNIQECKIVYDDNVYVSMEVPYKLFVKENDVIMCVRNGSKKLVGKNARVTSEDLGQTWGAFMMNIRSHSKDHFVYHFLNSDAFYKQMFPDLNTATISQITKGMLDSCKVLVPSNPERKLIADFLTSYDEAITAAKQELAKWKELKKGLLQQMFV